MKPMKWFVRFCMACLMAYAPMVAAYAGDGDEERGVSVITFVLHALGLKYVLLFPVAVIASVFLTLRSTKGTVHAATPLFVLLPFFVGLKGTTEGLGSMFLIIAQSVRAPEWREVSPGMTSSLFSLDIGLLLCLPAFLIVVWRLLRADGRA